MRARFGATHRLPQIEKGPPAVTAARAQSDAHKSLGDESDQPHAGPSRMCELPKSGSRHLLETPSVIRILRALWGGPDLIVRMTQVVATSYLAIHTVKKIEWVCGK